jgi:hypothetical protein
VSRTAFELEAIVQAAAWQPGEFGRAKADMASRMLQLLDEPFSVETASTVEFYDQILGGIEQMEAMGWTKAQADAFAEAQIAGFDREPRV